MKAKSQESKTDSSQAYWWYFTLRKLGPPSTPRFISFPFYCPFKDWSSGALFRTIPSLGFFLPQVSLWDRTCCNATSCHYKWLGQEDVKGTTAFVTLIIRIAVTYLAGMDSMGWEASLALPYPGEIISNLGRSITMLQWDLTAGFKLILTYESTLTCHTSH